MVVGFLEYIKFILGHGISGQPLYMRGTKSRSDGRHNKRKVINYVTNMNGTEAHARPLSGFVL